MSSEPSSSSTPALQPHAASSNSATTVSGSSPTPPSGSDYRAGPSTATSVSSPHHQAPPHPGGLGGAGVGGGGPATTAAVAAGPATAAHTISGPAAAPTQDTARDASAASGPNHHQQRLATPLQQNLPSPDQQRQVADARAAVVASIGNLLDSELQTRAASLHANAASLDRQERDVARATDGLRRENDRLAKWSGDGARRVKELGNVQNWAEVLEREFLVLEETMRLVREGSCESCGSGSASGSWTGSEASWRSGGSDADVRDGEWRQVTSDVVKGDVTMDVDNVPTGAELNAEDADKGKGKDVEGVANLVGSQGNEDAYADANGIAMQTAFSPASRSDEQAESGSGTDARTRESETTSFSTI